MCSTKAGNNKLLDRVVLPDNVVPHHYRVFLEPELEKYWYSGNVEIDVVAKRETNSVTVNVLKLNLGKVALNGEAPVNTSTDSHKEEITWEFPTTLKAGDKATLFVEFDGELNDEQAGFYRSVSTDDDGTKRIVATTQMESTDCRRAFPCFDEPALKATFDVSIAAPKHLTVLSNGAPARTETKGDKQITHFETTPLMSTYLVAFIVGELTHVTSSKFRVPVRVWADPGTEHKLQYAVDLAAETLAFFEKKFGIEYPMSKCDMVGIHSFASGAMENWGLITYRLVDLYFVEGEQSAKVKARVTEVIQHELAHQWFGNLVTMDWWDGLWLNEGFATWMSWYAGNDFFPEWKLWETYVSWTYAEGMLMDSVPSTHPVEVPIKHALEVPEVFDRISYYKGSMVINMLAQYLGQEEFIKGIALYLNRHKYGNTTTEDLWKALSDHSGKDIAKFMDRWVTAPGFPVLDVTVGADKEKVAIEQQRFLSTGKVDPKDDTTVWPIWPGLRRTDGTEDPSRTLITERRGEIAVGKALSEKDGFVKLNANQASLFRVHYPEELFQRLVAEGARGNDSRLNAEDRMGVVQDAWALAGQRGSISDLLDLADAWKNDPVPNVTYAVMSALQTLYRAMFGQPEDVLRAFEHFATDAMEPFLKREGLDFPADINVRTATVLAEVFEFVNELGTDKYITVSLELFEKEKFGANPNLLPGVTKAVGQRGTPAQWREMFDWYLAGNGTSGHDALEGLGGSPRTAELEELILAIGSGKVRSQDAHRAHEGLAQSTPSSAQFARRWYAEHWVETRKQFPGGSSSIRYIFEKLMDLGTEQEEYDRVKEYILPKKDLIVGIERTVNASLDRIQANYRLMQREAAHVREWLVKHKYL